MLIKINSGTVGNVPYNADGTRGVTVRSKTRFDPPFELDDESAQDLIARGVAVAVDNTEGKELGTAPLQTETLDEDALLQMTNPQLHDLAVQFGVDIDALGKRPKKADWVAAILNAAAANADAESGLIEPEDPE